MAFKSKTKSRTGIAAYGEYVAQLHQLAVGASSATRWRERTLAALNGQASAELRRLVPLKARRRFGAFFTGSELAGEFIAHYPKLSATSVIYDATLGGGDLLLAAASRLPLGRTVNETLHKWGRQLAG